MDLQDIVAEAHVVPTATERQSFPWAMLKAETLRSVGLDLGFTRNSVKVEMVERLGMVERVGLEAALAYQVTKRKADQEESALIESSRAAGRSKRARKSDTNGRTANGKDKEVKNANESAKKVRRTKSTGALRRSRRRSVRGAAADDEGQEEADEDDADEDAQGEDADEEVQRRDKDSDAAEGEVANADHNATMEGVEENADADGAEEDAEGEVEGVEEGDVSEEMDQEPKGEGVDTAVVAESQNLPATVNGADDTESALDVVPPTVADLTALASVDA